MKTQQTKQTESPAKMSNHNKKRNVGLIYEQLIRYASKCILENKTERAEIAMQILKEHFKPGTELYKEFRLFNALVKTTVPSESLAFRILEDARKAASTHDPKKLDDEKSSLIRNINKKIDFPGFFDMRIPEYRKLATVQTLLNDWRTGDSAISTKRIMYEAKIIDHLTEKIEVPKIVKKSEVTSLSLKLMQEKLDRKYSATLTQEQIKLINLYVKASTKGDTKPLKEACLSVKSRAVDAIGKLRKESKEKVLFEKVDPVKKEIDLLPEQNINEADLTKYLTLIKLISEVENKDDK
jgi:hypothetical protein